MVMHGIHALKLRCGSEVLYKGETATVVGRMGYKSGSTKPSLVLRQSDGSIQWGVHLKDLRRIKYYAMREVAGGEQAGKSLIALLRRHGNERTELAYPAWFVS